jgi:hypothetical protein
MGSEWVEASTSEVETDKLQEGEVGVRGAGNAGPEDMARDSLLDLGLALFCSAFPDHVGSQQRWQKVSGNIEVGMGTQ